MISDFPVNERPFEDSSFRRRLNDMVASINWLMSAKKDNKAEVIEEAPRRAMFRITGHAVIIADRRWSYTGKLYRWNPTLYSSSSGGWEADPNHTADFTLMNLKEEFNDADDTIQGNGVDFSSAIFGTTAGTLPKKLKPIGNGGGNTMVESVEFVRSGAEPSSTPVVYFSENNLVLEPCNT